MTSAQMLADSLFVAGMFFFILYLSMTKADTLYEAGLVMATSFVGALGYGLICEAVQYGRGGPSAALSETEPLWLILFEYLFLSITPTLL